MIAGTNTFEMNVIGKRTVKITCWATSTVGTIRPSQTPSQAIAVGEEQQEGEAGDEGRDALDPPADDEAGRP